MRPVLITAGATRNPLDAIRYISAGSSGRTGVWIAEQLHPHRPVHLLASPEAHLRASRTLQVQEYGSTRDLLDRMRAWVLHHPNGVVVHASAVGDYESAGAVANKLPSGQSQLVLRLRPTPKIVDQIKQWSEQTYLVSFKAASPETSIEQLRRLAQAQLERTRSDRVVANIIGRLQNLVLLVSPTETDRFDERSVALRALVDHLLTVV